MKHIKPWLGPALASILLNLLFFSLMPLMTDQEKDIYIKSIPSATRLNVVRLVQPDHEVIKKEPVKRAEKEKPIDNKPVDETVKTFSKQTPTDLPRLDFKVNLNIPAAQGLPSFPMETVVLSPLPISTTYTTAEIDNTITPITKIPPIYPFQAKRRGIEGWVKVRFMVNIHGQVEQVSIVESEPEGVFNQSVLNALPKWRFSPGTKEGIKVNTWVITTIRFELEH